MTHTHTHTLCKLENPQVRAAWKHQRKHPRWHSTLHGHHGETHNPPSHPSDGLTWLTCRDFPRKKVPSIIHASCEGFYKVNFKWWRCWGDLTFFFNGEFLLAPKTTTGNNTFPLPPSTGARGFSSTMAWQQKVSQNSVLQRMHMAWLDLWIRQNMTSVNMYIILNKQLDTLWHLIDLFELTTWLLHWSGPHRHWPTIVASRNSLSLTAFARFWPRVSPTVTSHIASASKTIEKVLKGNKFI